MWIHIEKSNGVLYQDGKKVNKFTIDGVIVDMVVHGKDTVWLKFV